MKDILISSFDMEVGGVERSLISMLNNFDYDNNKVDLMLYSHTGEFMDLIPKSPNLLDENKKALCFKQLFFNSKILVVIKNKYGRYVLQKAIKMMNDRQKCEIKNKLVNLDVSSMKEKNRIKSFLSFLEG